MTASDLVELAGREAIAPCPFCGGEAQALDFKGTKFKPAVSCTVCPADMPARTMAEAITAWNRRSPLPADGGAREALFLQVHDALEAAREKMRGAVEPDDRAVYDQVNAALYAVRARPSSRGEAEQK